MSTSASLSGARRAQPDTTSIYPQHTTQERCIYAAAWGKNQFLPPEGSVPVIVSKLRRARNEDLQIAPCTWSILDFYMHGVLQFIIRCSAVVGLVFSVAGIQAQVPVVTETNVTVRVVAANLTSGNFPRYETPGLNILKGLKPDVVAIQEFNCSNSFGINTTAAIRHMVDTTFGTNFSYFRESGYNIPNGIISRHPILTSGSWNDVQLTDRGFAWARIDLPGTNDLYVVSVHLHSGGGASSRAIEATNLVNLIQSNFPANAWIILGGDFNTDSRSEAALTRFKTILSDNPIPTDQAGDPDTTMNRNRPYDYVLASFSLTNFGTPVVIGSNHFTNGLVFDSRVYSPLADVPPVQSTDSGAFQMQHMAVVKDFKIPYAMTNFITVPPPVLAIDSADVIRWQGVSNLTYTVQVVTNLLMTNWVTLGTVSSATTNLSFTNATVEIPGRYYRVSYP